MSVDQKAKAIGKAGLNIRLASMLTKCDIVLDETLLSNNHSENENKTNTLESLFK